jgi:hypothetical protein
MVTRSTAAVSPRTLLLLLVLLVFEDVGGEETAEVIGCRGIDISFLAGLAIIMDLIY